MTRSGKSSGSTRASRRGARHMTVGLFIPCYVDAFFPEVGIATLELLERFGLESSTRSIRPAAASRWPTAVATTMPRPPSACSSSASRISTRRRAVRQLRPPRPRSPRRDRSDAAGHGRSARDDLELVEFLHDVREGRGLSLGGVPAQGRPAQQLLRSGACATPSRRRSTSPTSRSRWTCWPRSKGIEFVELDRPDECCGFGGTFCVSDEAVSAKMGYDQVHDFTATGPSTSSRPTCPA